MQSMVARSLQSMIRLYISLSPSSPLFLSLSFSPPLSFLIKQ